MYVHTNYACVIVVSLANFKISPIFIFQLKYLTNVYVYIYIYVSVGEHRTTSDGNSPTQSTQIFYVNRIYKFIFSSYYTQAPLQHSNNTVFSRLTCVSLILELLAFSQNISMCLLFFVCLSPEC